MARPRNPDRDAVADKTLTVRFTQPELARLDVLLAQRVAELRGTGAKLNTGGLVRAIVLRELDSLGIHAPATSPAAAQPTLPGLDAPAPAPAFEEKKAPAATPTAPASTPAPTPAGRKKTAKAPPQAKPTPAKPAKPAPKNPKKKPRR
jgi:hypothetical protein